MAGWNINNSAAAAAGIINGVDGALECHAVVGHAVTDGAKLLRRGCGHDDFIGVIYRYHNPGPQPVSQLHLMARGVVHKG